MSAQIFQALASGFSAQQVIDYIIKKFPSHAKKITKAIQEGYKPDDILRHLAGRKAGFDTEGMTEFEQARSKDIERSKNINRAALTGAGIGAAAIATPAASRVLGNAFSRALPHSLQNLSGGNLPPMPSNIQPPLQGTIQTQPQNQLLNPSQSPSSPPSAPTAQPNTNISQQPNIQQPQINPIAQQKDGKRLEALQKFNKKAKKKGILDEEIERFEKEYGPMAPEEKIAIEAEQEPTNLQPESTELVENKIKIPKEFENKTEKEVLESAYKKLSRGNKYKETIPENNKIFYHVVPENYKQGSPIYSGKDYENISKEKIDLEKKWPDYEGYRKSKDFKNVSITPDYDVAYEFLKGQFNGKGKILSINIDPNKYKLSHNSEGYLITPRIQSNDIIGEVESDIGKIQQKQTPIAKNDTVSTPHGIGEVKEIRNGKAIVEVDGKKHQIDEDELESSPLPEKELAQLHEDLIKGIEEETGEEVSRHVTYIGFDPNRKELTYMPWRGNPYTFENVTDKELADLKDKMNRKTSDENFIGAYQEGTESPIGAAMSEFMQRRKQAQKEKGIEKKEPIHKAKFEKLYYAYEPAEKAAEARYKERKKQSKKNT